MKLLVTGGHLTPALATIDFFQKKEPDWKIIFVGRKFSQEKNKQQSREEIEANKRNVPFVTLQSPRFTFINWWQVLLKLPALMRAVLQSFLILIKNKPDMILSFGGYLAVPVAFAGWLLRVPIITHEQTRTSGIANRIIARWTTKVAISYASSENSFPKKKTVLTGNPLRSSLWQKKPNKPSWISPIKKEKPLLYITGGNQGSEIINSVVGQALPHLIKKWTIIHQCGLPTSSVHYKNELEKIRRKLSPTSQKAYFIREWITEDELAWIYHHAQCIVSRAGANTTQEIEVLRIPAILIPLPFAHASEQLLNAQALVKQKNAIMIEQKDFNAETLQTALAKYHSKSKRSYKKPTSEEITQPAQKIYELVKKINS